MKIFELLEKQHFDPKDPTFLKSLDNWLFRSTQNDATEMDKFEIPLILKRPMKLYRGMLLPNSQDEFEIAKYSSWSKDRTVAEKFANDHASENAVIVEREFTSDEILLDVDAFVQVVKYDIEDSIDAMALDSALKEKEVIVRPGIKITHKI